MVLYLKSMPKLSCMELQPFKYLLFMLSIFHLPPTDRHCPCKGKMSHKWYKDLILPPLGFEGLYLIILALFCVPSGKQINKYAGPVILCQILTFTMGHKMTFLAHNVHDEGRYTIEPYAKSLRHRRHWHGRRPSCWSPMISWQTALRYHSDNQKEDEVTWSSTCVDARPRMNNTVSAPVSFTRARSRILGREPLQQSSWQWQNSDRQL